MEIYSTMDTMNEDISALHQADCDIQQEYVDELKSKKITPEQFTQKQEVWEKEFKERLKILIEK